MDVSGHALTTLLWGKSSYWTGDQDSLRAMVVRRKVLTPFPGFEPWTSSVATHY